MQNNGVIIAQRFEFFILLCLIALFMPQAVPAIGKITQVIVDTSAPADTLKIDAKTNQVSYMPVCYGSANNTVVNIYIHKQV